MYALNVYLMGEKSTKWEKPSGCAWLFMIRLCYLTWLIFEGEIL